MAEFGVQATELSAPQGAGARVIEPVRQAPTVDGMSSIFTGIAKSAVEMLSDYGKSSAKGVKDTVLNQFGEQLSKINQGIVTGEHSPDRGAAMARAISSKFKGSYGAFAKDLDEVYKSFLGTSEFDDAEEQRKVMRDQRKADIAGASSRGAVFFPGMNESTIQSQLLADKASIRAKEEFDAHRARAAENRAQGSYDRELEASENKRVANKILTDIAGARIPALHTFGADLLDKVKAGTVKPEDATVIFGQQISTLRGYINAAGTNNPEMIGPYKSMIDDVNKLYTEGFTSKDPVDELKKRVQQMQLHTQFTLLQDPQIRVAAGLSDLLKTNAGLALAATAPSQRAIIEYVNNPPDMNAPLTPITGNPQVETDFIKFLQKTTSELGNGTMEKSPKSQQEAIQTLNNYLGDLKRNIDTAKTDPVRLKKAAAYFASPEFGKVVQTGKLSQDALDGANSTFQIYTDRLRAEIAKQTSTVFVKTYGSTPAPGQDNVKKTKETTGKYGDLVDIVFNGSNVKFVAKKGITDEASLKAQAVALRELDASAQVATQIIKIGSHMNKTTDYAGQWEKYRAELFPTMVFPEASNDFGSKTIKPTGPLKTEEAAKAAMQPPTGDELIGERTQTAPYMIRSIESELARKTLSPEGRKILEEELKKWKGK
jgi:hypothetical protein